MLIGVARGGCVAGLVAQQEPGAKIEAGPSFPIVS